MYHHKHLTIKERELILMFSAKGATITELAKQLCRNKSTISRELKRNSANNNYLPSEAEEMYKIRRQRCKPTKKLSNPILYNLVKGKCLNHQWCPEESEGR